MPLTHPPSALIHEATNEFHMKVAGTALGPSSGIVDVLLANDFQIPQHLEAIGVAMPPVVFTWCLCGEHE